MNILAIETSCGKASVAIYKNKEIAAFECDNALNMQAENLFPLIDKAFLQSDLNYNDINYLSATTGPGSFTGIRIGLSAAKGILLAAKHIAPLAISNFEVIAFRATRQVKKLKNIVVIFECSQDSVYLQSFDSLLSTNHAADLLEIKDIEYYLKDFTGPTAIAGNGIKTAKNFIPEKPDLFILPRYPEIDARLSISLSAYKIRFGKDISSNLEPLYIKPASAKIYSQPI
jgi:tRNA threonylcarbamoyl adenosine modification protein YeaZ